MKKELRAYFAKIGAKGGKASRRTLSPQQARAMVAAREALRREKLKRPAGRSSTVVRDGGPKTP